MASIHPHINFNGNAEEAFLFYQAAFGGSFSKVIRFKELESGDFVVPAHEVNKIMHISLPIGHGFLMGNDVPEFLGPTNEHENRSKIVVHTESREEANRLFNALTSGGQIEMPMGDSPWGTYFGMFRDKFGIEWMLEFDEQSG